jgi:hypothetical protein
MSVIDGKARFAAPRLLAHCVGWHRWMAQRMFTIEAWTCRRAGDEAGFAEWMAKAEAARSLSRSQGPPIPMPAPVPTVGRRPDPPASPEEP